LSGFYERKIMDSMTDRSGKSHLDDVTTDMGECYYTQMK